MAQSALGRSLGSEHCSTSGCTAYHAAWSIGRYVTKSKAEAERRVCPPPPPPPAFTGEAGRLEQLLFLPFPKLQDHDDLDNGAQFHPPELRYNRGQAWVSAWMGGSQCRVQHAVTQGQGQQQADLQWMLQLCPRAFHTQKQVPDTLYPISLPIIQRCQLTGALSALEIYRIYRIY